MESVRVVLDDGAFIPERAHDDDAGYDLRSPIDIVLQAHSHITVDTGVHMEIPSGYVGFLKAKSGLNVVYDITGTGVIDSGYTGSIKVKLYNHGDTFHKFARGDKLIQLVLLPIFTPELVTVNSLGETERGDSGFGSTGK